MSQCPLDRASPRESFPAHSSSCHARPSRLKPREYHDLSTDPYELRNIFTMLTAAEKSALHAAIAAMQAWHGSESCWAAQHPKLGGSTNAQS